MRMSQTELQALGDKITRVISAKVNRTLLVAQETLETELTEYDLDQLLLELEQGLAENGIDAVFYPIQ